MAAFSKLFVAVALAAAAQASPALRRQNDNTQPVGTNPIGGFTVDFLGNQVADNSCTHRDLGFAGHIKGTWYAVYGDNLWCDTGVSNPDMDTDGFHGLVRDSVSALGTNPLVVHDLNLNGDSPVAHPNQFVPFNAGWGETNTVGFGGTSLVETDFDSATGALYYLVNANEDYKGAGIAKVQVQNGVPTVTQRLGTNGIWWDADNTPKYGDVAAFRDPHSEYIYIWGNPPNSESSYPGNSYVYQARVKAADAFDLSKYQYWWGRDQGWKSDVLTAFGANTAVMWGVGQGSVVYSKYFSTYFYVHLGGSKVYLRAAPAPEGPWTDSKEIFTATPIDGGFVYSGVAYPYLDDSGKTLTVAFTNSNHIQVIKINFA